MFDDEPIRKKASTHEVGQDLAQLSVQELSERIELLRQEILRLEQMKAAKENVKNAADAFFKS